MKLIADSGSTKSDWALLQASGEVLRAKTSGLNPYFHDAGSVQRVLEEELLPLLNIEKEAIHEVYFYGAGCSSAHRNARVEEGLNIIFSNASVHVEHDLLGAARAVSGKEKSSVVILGTGSNTCSFDGERILESRGGLGYVLGDEGSGAWLGKHLLRDLFYGKLAGSIESDLWKYAGRNKDEILDRVYNQPEPNRYLASFAPFIKENLSDDHLRSIVGSGFHALFTQHVVHLPDYKSVPLNSVGSIGLQFRDVLETVAIEYDVELNRTISDPIEGLISYHR